LTTEPAETTEVKVVIDPDYKKDLRKRTLKKIGMFLMAVLVFGISCLGAMDSPDFVEPDPYEKPSEDK
jgi:hypothetical protein